MRNMRLWAQHGEVKAATAAAEVAATRLQVQPDDLQAR